VVTAAAGSARSVPIIGFANSGQLMAAEYNFQRQLIAFVI
jgi:hypothetical protein